MNNHPHKYQYQKDIGYCVNRLLLQKLVHRTKKINVNEDWMGDDPSLAFLKALGAGPWKYDRRALVQEHAIRWFRGHGCKDISDISPSRVRLVYPLDWQNNFLYSMVNSLREDKSKFSDLCLKWSESGDWETSLLDIFNRCETTVEGPKVLWMFSRDFLKIPSFPIDRHVKKVLKEFELPDNSFEMVHLCLRAGIDPNPLARNIFGGFASNESSGSRHRTIEL